MRGDIHDVKVCRRTPPLLHLLFVDDCFLFCRADNTKISIIKEILDTYDQALGQFINYQKLEVFFSANTQHHVRRKLFSHLCVSETIGSSKYLGLTTIIGKRKK